METLELERLGLSELSIEVTKETNGGWWQAALAIIGAGIYIYNNADDFAAGFKEGMAAY